MEIILKGTLPQITEAIKQFASAGVFPAEVASRDTKGEDNAPTTNESSGDGVADTRSSGRRTGRGKSDDAMGGDGDTTSKRGNKSSDTADSKPSGKGKSAGRRTGRKTSKPAPKDAPLDDELDDIDLAKAASDAAGVLTPKGVTSILESLGVGGVEELVADQRQEFLDLLKDAVAEQE